MYLYLICLNGTRILLESTAKSSTLMTPYLGPSSTVIVPRIDMYPDPLNLKSKREWISAYIELPTDYGLNNINITSILLNGTIPVDLAAEVGDYDGDRISGLMIKFNCSKVSEFILSGGSVVGDVTLVIAFQLTGTSCEGFDVIEVRMPGDINMNGTVNFQDTIPVGLAFASKLGAPNWNQAADENEDGVINFIDVILLGQNFGEIYL